MADVLTVAEYATATTTIRARMSELAAAELAATTAALAKLRTAAGKTEMRRRAQTNAERIMNHARMAGRIAGLAALSRESIEPDHVGRQRLIEATAELHGLTPEQVERQYYRVKPTRGRGRPPGSKNKPKPMILSVPYGTLDQQTTTKEA